MTCSDVDALIEDHAAGDTVADEGLQAHLASCPACAAAFTLARQIDAGLRAQEVADAPPAFTAQVMSRLRRERWRSEQRLDRAFNAVIAVAAVLVLTGLWLLASLSGLVSITADVSRMVAAGAEVAGERLAPVLPTYAGGTLLLLAALALWWWAEREGVM
jgi:anti-sigma factor RsiW